MIFIFISIIRFMFILMHLLRSRVDMYIFFKVKAAGKKGKSLTLGHRCTAKPCPQCKDTLDEPGHVRYEHSGVLWRPQRGRNPLLNQFGIFACWICSPHHSPVNSPLPSPSPLPTFLLKTSTLFDVFLIPFVISWAKLNCGSPSQKAQT